MNLNHDEYLEYLESSGQKIIINDKFFKITNDPLLLAKFCNDNIKKNGTLLDIGSGNGILPLLLVKNTFLTNIFGVEIQKNIYDYFEKNIRINDLNDKIFSYHTDINEFTPIDKFDYIISNPPYYKMTSGKLPEVEELLISKFEKKLNLEELIFSIKRLLKNHGKFFIIIIPDRFNDIMKYVYSNNLNIIRVKTVSYNNNIKFILIEGQNGGTPKKTFFENENF